MCPRGLDCLKEAERSSQYLTRQIHRHGILSLLRELLVGSKKAHHDSHRLHHNLPGRLLEGRMKTGSHRFPHIRLLALFHYLAVEWAVVRALGLQDGAR